MIKKKRQGEVSAAMRRGGGGVREQQVGWSRGTSWSRGPFRAGTN